MIAWLLGLGTVLGAPPEWTEVRINNLVVSSVNPLLGQASLNARQVDMDLDGKIDLVFADRVLFQRSGTFDESGAVPLPRVTDGPAIDFYNHTLFLRFPDGLQSYAFADGGWQIRLDMATTWAHERQPPPPSEDDPAPAPRQPAFEQYVYDIDGDGFPELLFPLQDGLHIYRLEDGLFTHTEPLQIFPSARLIPLEALDAATGVSRSITFPDQYVRFHCVIDSPTVTIVTQHRENDAEIRFESVRYSISRAEGGYQATLQGERRASEPLMGNMQPVRVDSDGEIAYVGASLDYASTLALLTPIFTTRIKHSGDEEQLFRAKSFTPHTILADVDRDGKLDLIQETTHIADGGLRETLMRFTTQKTFRHTVAVHPGLGGGRFVEEPAFSKTIHIRLDQTPIRLSTMFQRYQAGKLVNLTGDFDGDGRNDLLVQTGQEELSLYLHGNAGLEDDPAVTLPIQEYETFHVVDINGDKVSDILFQGEPLNEIQTRNTSRALLFNVSGGKP